MTENKPGREANLYSSPRVISDHIREDAIIQILAHMEYIINEMRLFVESLKGGRRVNRRIILKSEVPSSQVGQYEGFCFLIRDGVQSGGKVQNFGTIFRHFLPCKRRW